MLCRLLWKCLNKKCSSKSSMIGFGRSLRCTTIFFWRTSTKATTTWPSRRWWWSSLLLGLKSTQSSSLKWVLFLFWHIANRTVFKVFTVSSRFRYIFVMRNAENEWDASIIFYHSESCVFIKSSKLVQEKINNLLLCKNNRIWLLLSDRWRHFCKHSQIGRSVQNWYAFEKGKKLSLSRFPSYFKDKEPTFLDNLYSVSYYQRNKKISGKSEIEKILSIDTFWILD